MASLFAAVLVCALVLAIPATAAMFVGRPKAPWLRRAWRTLMVVVGVGLGSLVVCKLAGFDTDQVLVTTFVLAGVTAGFAGQLDAWNVRGLVVWSLTVTAGAAYLGFVAVWLLTNNLSAVAMLGGWALWLLESFVYVLGLGYLWEMVDVLARWSWRRRIGLQHALEDGQIAHHPFVSLHVPTHNEPPDMVIETLRTLLALDYPAYEVLVLDNNTTEPALWEPVRDLCDQHAQLRFFHLENLSGYKSGALNFGLSQTDPRAEIIGIVDADYQVDSDFLAKCAQLFVDEDLAFVQTPQDYRDWEHDPYFRRLYLSYSYFFDVSQRSRNERNGAIFGGTMGLIRRSALEEVGGWDEWCITEDAELSLRMLKAGWSGTHVEQSFGHGMMPLTFEALKRQRFRWCFGGIQILRMHISALLPGRRTAKNQLTLSQRWAYLVGGLQWFGDVAGLLFTTFVLIGALSLSTGGGVVIRQFSGPLLISVVSLMLLSWLRSVALLRRTEGATWVEAFGALTIWLGLSWVVAQASVRGLVAREGAFLRTPKTKGEVGWRQSLRGNLVELSLSGLGLLGAVIALTAIARETAGAIVVATLLLIQAAGFASAPWNSLAANRADLTPEQRRRRRDALLSWTRSPGVRRAGLGPVLAGAVITISVIAFAAPVGAPLLNEVPNAATKDDGRAQPTDQPSSDATRPSDGSSGDSTGSTAGPQTPTQNGEATPAARPTAASSTPNPGRQPTTLPTSAAATRKPAHAATGRPTSTPRNAPD